MADNEALPSILRLVVSTGIFFGGLAWAVLRTRWRSRAPEHWLPTSATIHHGTVTPIEKSAMCTAKLSYSYFVDEYRAGWHEQLCRDEDAAYDFVRRLKDKKVKARYNPKNPDRSALEITSVKEIEGMAILDETAGTAY